MALEVSGKVHHIGETEEVGGNGFKKRQFVIETGGDYPQMVAFEVVGEKVDIVDGFDFGDEVDVSFNLRGRQWEDKYFTNLQAWKITKSN